MSLDLHEPAAKPEVDVVGIELWLLPEEALGLERHGVVEVIWIMGELP